MNTSRKSKLSHGILLSHTIQLLQLNYNDMATKAMIYVPECNVDVFKTDADSHGVEIELLEVDYFDNYIFDAEGEALNDNDWIEYLEANGIEVSVFSEILEGV